MNSNSTPFKKRNNPFADVGVTPVVQEEPKPVVQPVVAPTPAPVAQPKKEIDDSNREKYTATMEKTLRKRVKIAAATAGIQVSTFIEEACKEKLEREGL